MDRFTRERFDKIEKQVEELRMNVVSWRDKVIDLEDKVNMLIEGRVDKPKQAGAKSGGR
jgi:hypothetical protein